MQVLVCTDTAEYGDEATLYPLMRHLARHGDVDAVFIADRAIRGNEAFYKAPGIKGRTVLARRADANFAFENQGDYLPEKIDPDTMDALWLRLDLAPDEFLRAVELRWAGRFISNRPSGIIRTTTKAFLLSLQPLLGDLIAGVALCQSLENVRQFRAQHPDIVLKVLRSFGGKGVVRVRQNGESDLKTDQDIEDFLIRNGACLAMEYLDNPQQSDNRLIVSNGKILGALARVPKPGGWLCNILAGGSYEIAEPSPREIEMVRRIDPAMRQLGIHFYGVDTLLNSRSDRILSEINTMNAGCVCRYELKTGRRIADIIAADFVKNAKTMDSIATRSNKDF